MPYKKNSNLIFLPLLAFTSLIGTAFPSINALSAPSEIDKSLTVDQSSTPIPIEATSYENNDVIELKEDESSEVDESSTPISTEEILPKNNDLNEVRDNQSGLYSILNPNLLNIDGPEVSLVFKQTQAKQIFEYMAEIGNYGFVWVRNNPANASDIDGERLITLTLNQVSYKKAFNALLLASGLQAKLHNNVLYIGPNVRNTVFTSRSSGVYQLNQISASSAADYLANLGASVTKTYTITTSVTSGASQSQAVQGSSTSSTTTDQSETSVKVYGATIGPLVGLIATTDERLQTVTMVGEKPLIDLASVFLERLDKKQKQVALSVRVLDVNLSDKDSFSQSFGRAFKGGSPFIVGTAGTITTALGRYIPNFGDPVDNPSQQYTASADFFGTLQASIEKGSTKVLASPTLLLSESSGSAGDGTEIGRKFGNEGFVEVGDEVPVNASFEPGKGCQFEYDLVGVKLGAKILGIDQNKYITFTMSPQVTGISSLLTIPGCGQVNILNSRRVDTGSVRIKDGETLVLTGVITDTDVEKLYKFPILGDLPLLGSIFRSKSSESTKRELIVLVTPTLIIDSDINIQKKYNLNFSDEKANELIKEIR